MTKKRIYVYTVFGMRWKMCIRDRDCANCANLMEDAAKKTVGVANATVNFMTQKIIVEFEEGKEPKTVMKDVLKACKKVEPDCEIEL